MKYCWTSPIILIANSVEKMQVFCAWSSLRMSACTVPRTAAQRLGLDPLVDVAARRPVAADARAAPSPSPSLPAGQLARVRRARPVARSRRRGVAAPPPAARLPQIALHLLIDRRVHEEGEDDRRRAVDRHRHRCRRRHRGQSPSRASSRRRASRSTRRSCRPCRRCPGARAGPRRTASPSRTRSRGAPPAGPRDR